MTVSLKLTNPDNVTVAVKLKNLTVWLACAGSQYCCWNNDSSLVAVSSDYYRAVMVFDVHKKQQVCLHMLSTLCTHVESNVKKTLLVLWFRYLSRK